MYVHAQKNISNRSPLFYATALLITLIPLYIGSYRYRLYHPYGGARGSRAPASTDFVQDWLDTQIIAPFNPSAIAQYCNSTPQWRPNLIFRLDNANGGIGNVRGNILDFVFYALEAGASIIPPSMARRSEEDISNVWADRAPFDTFFDRNWFLEKLGEACPRMVVYEPEDERAVVGGGTVVKGNYVPRSRRVDEDKSFTRTGYLEHLDSWLQAQSGYDEGIVTVVSLERTLWEVDTRSLPRGFRRSFGQLLRINPAIRQLAADVVNEMNSRFHLDIDPRDAIPRHKFYGAHLRTEADAQHAGWLDQPNANFSAQTSAYIAHALHHNLKVLYVASGNTSDIERFKLSAAASRLNVTSKLDLLPSPSVLENLTWDQQALIDYEVLMRSSVFGGFVKSSFSYNIAMTRDQWVVDQGRMVEPWFVVHREEGVAFDDGVSRMLARDEWHERRIPRGMWP